MCALDQEPLNHFRQSRFEPKPIGSLLADSDVKKMLGRYRHHDFCAGIPPSSLEIVAARLVVIQSEHRMIGKRPFETIGRLDYAPAMVTKRLRYFAQEVVQCCNPKTTTDGEFAFKDGLVRRRIVRMRIPVNLTSDSV